MGAAFGATVVCVLGLSFDLEFSEAFTKFYTFIASSALTLFAAGVALCVGIANIESTREQKEDERQRQLRAYRAELPLTLSKFYGATRAGLRNSLNFEARVEMMGADEFAKTSRDEIALPTEAVNNFKDVLIHLDRGDAARRMEAILKEFQISAARWEGRFRETEASLIRRNNTDKQEVARWAYLSALVSSMFDYARDEGEIGLISRQNIQAALKNELKGSQFEVDYGEEIEMYVRTHARRDRQLR